MQVAVGETRRALKSHWRGVISESGMVAVRSKFIVDTPQVEINAVPEAGNASSSGLTRNWPPREVTIRSKFSGCRGESQRGDLN
jgi:hypothetical protein